MSEVTIIDTGSLPITVGTAPGLLISPSLPGLLGTLDQAQQIEMIYIAYFDRAADGAGNTFWSDQDLQAQNSGQPAVTALNNVANAFASQPETVALYPFLGATPQDLTTAAVQTELGAFVNQIYENLFDHTADAAGLTYWTNQISGGAIGLGDAALDIANGATGADSTYVQNKVAVALDFTGQTVVAGLGQSEPLPTSFLAAARGVLNGVDGASLNDASVTTVEATTAAYVASNTPSTGTVNPPVPPTGPVITMTHEPPSGVNFIPAPVDGSTVTVDLGSNTIGGSFNGTTLATPLGNGDVIDLHSGGPEPGFGGTVNDTVWAGVRTTINLGVTANPWGGTAALPAAGDNATILVMGDVTGATSGDNPAMTVVTGFLNAPAGVANVTLQFFNASLTPAVPRWSWTAASAVKAEVNMAAATSLANALDIAASQTVQIDALSDGGHTKVTNGVVQLNAYTGLADWFQYAGNTYVVEAVNTTGSAAVHASLATTDVVVELTGHINLITAMNAGYLHFA